MTAGAAVFWILAVVTVSSAAVVVLARSLIYSAFALLFTFFGVAGLYVLLGADFLAATQLLIYVGGILVLLPIALALMVVMGGLVMAKPMANGFFWDKYVGWPLTIALFVFLFTGIVRAVQWSRRRLQELAA